MVRYGVSGQFKLQQKVAGRSQVRPAPALAPARKTSYSTILVERQRKGACRGAFRTRIVDERLRTSSQRRSWLHVENISPHLEYNTACAEFCVFLPCCKAIAPLWMQWGDANAPAGHCASCCSPPATAAIPVNSERMHLYHSIFCLLECMMPMKLACRRPQLHDVVLVAAQMRLCTNARGTVVPVGQCCSHLERTQAALYIHVCECTAAAHLESCPAASCLVSLARTSSSFRGGRLLLRCRLNTLTFSKLLKNRIFELMISSMVSFHRPFIA